MSHSLSIDDFPSLRDAVDSPLISRPAKDSEGNEITLFFGHVTKVQNASSQSKGPFLGFVTFGPPFLKKQHRERQRAPFFSFQQEDILPSSNSTVRRISVNDLAVFRVISDKNKKKATNVEIMTEEAFTEIKSLFTIHKQVAQFQLQIKQLQEKCAAKIKKMEERKSVIIAKFYNQPQQLNEESPNGAEKEIFPEEDTIASVSAADALLSHGDQLEIVEETLTPSRESKPQESSSEKHAQKPAAEATPSKRQQKEKSPAKKKRYQVTPVQPPQMQIQPTLSHQDALKQIEDSLEKKDYATAVETLVSNVDFQKSDPALLLEKFAPLFAQVVQSKLGSELVYRFIDYLHVCMGTDSPRNRTAFQEVLVELVLECSRFLYTREFTARSRIIAKAISDVPNVNHRSNRAQDPLYLLSSNYRSQMYKYESLRRIERFFSSAAVALPLHNYFLTQRYSHIKERLEDLETQWYEENARRSKKHPVPPSDNDAVRFGTTGTVSTFHNDPEARIQSLKNVFEKASFEKSALSENIDSLINTLMPSPKEYESKKAAVKEMQKVVQKVLGSSAQLHKYGSSASGFGMKGCDVDLCLTVGNSDEDQNDNRVQSHYLHQIQHRLERKSRAEQHILLKQTVSRSRVPILKLEDTDHKVEMDICMGTLLGVANTKMLKRYASIHPKVRSLIYIVKHWAKKRKINDAASGSLSSYSYVLLTIAYLQELGVLPSLQKLVQHEKCDDADVSTPRFLNGFDCQFFKNIGALSNLWKPATDIDSITIAELFYGFFCYYCDVLDTADSVVSIKQGTLLKKNWPSPLSIEDPFELRDLGTVITDQKAPLIKAEFERARDLLAGGKSLDEIIKPPVHEVDDTNIYAQKRPNYEAHQQLTEITDLIEKGHVFQGHIRVNAKRFFEAYVTLDGFDKDIYLDGLNARNRALHGDLVAIKVLERDEKTGQHNGQVLSIIQRKAPLLYACTVMKQDRPGGHHWLLPIEKIYPKIMVEFSDFGEKFNMKGCDLEDHLFVVKLNAHWKLSSRFPKGEIVGTLGLRRDLWAQKRAIFLQQMPQLFEPLYADKDATALDSEEYKDQIRISTDRINVEHDTSMDHLYQDWSKRRIFTIDPTQSRDLDDALSIEKLDDGRFKIGVYIADVTRFLHGNNEHDKEAQERCTSVYMIDMVEHMLNPQLSQDEASILPNVPRFSVAIEWIMEQNGKVDFDSVEFAKGKIASCCRLDYDTVQEILEGADKDIVVSEPFTKEDIINDVHTMNGIAQNLKSRRKNSGAVSLDSTDLEFDLDESGYPIGVQRPVHNESHELVAEFMLMANQLTAITLHNEFGDEAVQRQHEAPDDVSLMTTVLRYGRALNRLIAQLPVSNASELLFGTEEIEKALVQLQTEGEMVLSSQEAMNQLIEGTERFQDIQNCMRHILLREMNIGKYAREGDRTKQEKTVHHFALNMPYYTHFTSPIRRYADVLVHRQIMELIKAKHEKRSAVPPLRGAELTNTIEKINEQSIKAKGIQEQLNKLYLTHFVQKQIREGHLIRKKATIMSLGRRSFTVYIGDYGTEIQCGLMKDMHVTPSYIHSTDVVSSGPDLATGNEVESLNVLWTDPQNEFNVQKEIQLYTLKTIYVDLTTNFEKIPASLVIYDIWEYNEKTDGVPPAKTLQLKAPVQNPKKDRHSKKPGSARSTPKKERRRRDRRTPERRSRRNSKASARDSSPEPRRLDDATQQNSRRNRAQRRHAHNAKKANLNADFTSSFMAVNANGGGGNEAKNNQSQNGSRSNSHRGRRGRGGRRTGGGPRRGGNSRWKE